MAIKLEKGHGKDGNPSYPYVHAHPPTTTGATT
jgi:hypothetical protein